MIGLFVKEERLHNPCGFVSDIYYNGDWKFYFSHPSSKFTKFYYFSRMQEPQQERYLLKQHYESVLPRRIRQGVEGPSTTLTRRLSQAVSGAWPSGKLAFECQKIAQKMSSFGQFFDSQMAIFRRVSLRCIKGTLKFQSNRDLFCGVIAPFNVKIS